MTSGLNLEGLFKSPKGPGIWHLTLRAFLSREKVANVQMCSTVAEIIRTRKFVHMAT